MQILYMILQIHHTLIFSWSPRLCSIIYPPTMPTQIIQFPPMKLFLLQNSLLILSLSLLLLGYRRRRLLKKTPASHAGLLSPYPFLGILPQFLNNRHRFLEWLVEILSAHPTHNVDFRTPGDVHGIITASPATVEHVLKTNFGNYPKGERTVSMMSDFLGLGIFNSDGEEWKLQRKTASFEFNKRSLRAFVVDAVRNETLERLVPVLRRASEEGRPVDVQDALERFAFDNICKVVFDEDPAWLGGGGGDEFMRAFTDAQRISADRFMSALPFTWRLKRLCNVGSERRLKESIAVVREFVTRVIQSRKKREGSRAEHADLLSRFDEAGKYSEEALRDIVVNFMVAGRETTSSALTWFFWIVSSRPEVVAKVLEEIRSVRARTMSTRNESSTFGYDELREMHYLHAAISEAMRLYPPVALDTVECRGEDVLPDGTYVGKGWFVTYSAYVMGRLESIWGKDCLEYRPERWLGEEDGAFKAESPFKYPVFHAGPRMCLGREMAYTQMKAVAACVIERFVMEAVEKVEEPKYVISLTLRMKGGLWMRVKERELEGEAMV
ncbi:Cytochrome P450 94A2 [Acorus gramineus]|uniref:Cytochrome P450 94A2 n=1 Tax=Acorus gramineus TaxID=55184 RepID=A0AAV9BP69_ACOGR|nr:Cytochrome P450 94A2 [Acorus gramineus]